MTDQEIEKAGIKALQDSLGWEGAVRFLEILINGRGDYTKEKYESPEPSYEEIRAGIMSMRNGAQYNEKT